MYAYQSLLTICVHVTEKHEWAAFAFRRFVYYFNKSLTTGCFHAEFKEAMHIAPIARPAAAEERWT